VDFSSFQTLLTPYGQQALDATVALAPDEADFLRAFTRLRRSYPAELAQAALETAILRRKAAAKFPQASRMYFTREALEQATAFEVSTYRCARFGGCDRMLDLGCSIGGDTLALAALAPTTGLDLDPLRLAIAQVNLQSILPDRPVDFIQADLKQALPVSLPPGVGLFFDPARRDRGKRIHSVSNYQPPLDVIRGWLEHAPPLGVKLSPGIDPNELAGYDAELEFISLNGELKEAVLWFGPLKSARRRATLLPAGSTLAASLDESGEQGSPDLPGNWSDSGPELPLSEPRDVIYEPDPAILRAGLVRALGAQLGAFQLDPDIAYLTGDQAVDTPFARTFTVETWLPFNLKRLRQVLRERRIEALVVKKRGSPIQPVELIQALRLSPGSRGFGEERTLILTHLRARPIAIICQPRMRPVDALE